MRSTERLLLLFLAIALIACTPSAQQPPAVEEAASQATTEADVAAITAVMLGLSEAINAADLEAWMSAFADDVIFLPPNEPIIQGKEAIRAWVGPYFAGMEAQESGQIVEVEVAGDWAWVYSTVEFSGTAMESGETVHETAKSISILERQADGSWLITRSCWNGDAPPSES